MKKGIRVLAINAETGEEISFDKVKDAAYFAGVRSTTMSNRIRTRSVDKKGYYYIAEEPTEEELERKCRRQKWKSTKEYKSDDVNLTQGITYWNMK